MALSVNATGFEGERERGRAWAAREGSDTGGVARKRVENGNGFERTVSDVTAAIDADISENRAPGC